MFGNVRVVPSESLLQKVCVLAYLVHQDVVVSLHFQSLMIGRFGHRRGEECEGVEGHNLKTLIICLRTLFLSVLL